MKRRQAKFPNNLSAYGRKCACCKMPLGPQCFGGTYATGVDAMLDGKIHPINCPELCVTCMHLGQHLNRWYRFKWLMFYRCPPLTIWWLVRHFWELFGHPKPVALVWAEQEAKEITVPKYPMNSRNTLVK